MNLNKLKLIVLLFVMTISSFANSKPVLVIGNDYAVFQGTEVDLMEGVSANDTEDGDLSEDIFIDSRTLNINKPESYEIKYVVTDSDGNTVQSSKHVNILEGTKDANQDGYSLARASRTYNISGMGYEHFSGTFGGENNPTAKGKTVRLVGLADGDVFYDSGEFIYDEETKNISLDITGKSNITTIYEGNFDVSSLNIANPKLYKKDLDDDYKDLAPSIYISNDSVVILNESFDLMEGITASDTEDGNITDKITIDDGGFDSSKSGSYNASYSVYDSANNHTVKSRVVKVNTRPIITIASPLEIIQGTQANLMEGVTASDTEDGDITSNVVVDSSSLDMNIVGSYTLTYSVTDSNGTSASETRVATVVAPNTLPVLTISGDLTTNLGVPISVYERITATDAEDGDITSRVRTMVSDTPYNFNKLGTYEIVYSVSDTDGAVTTATRILNVVNSNIPVLEGIEDLVVNVGEIPNYTEGITATDVEDGDITSGIIIDSNDVNNNLSGTYIVTYSITDSNGNTTTEIRNVIINTLPVLTIEEDLVVNIGETPDYLVGVTAYDVEDGDLTSSIIVDSSSVNIQLAGTYIATYSVYDNTNNHTIKSRVIKVNTFPIINITGDLSTKIGIPLNIYEGITATDAEDGNLTSKVRSMISDTPYNFNKLGTYEIGYSVSDTDKAVTTATRILNVVNSNVPVLEGMEDLVVNVGETPNYTEGVTATDVEDGDLTSGIIIDSSGVNNNLSGTYIVTYSIIDSDGNTIVIRRNIIMNALPIITGVEDLVVNLGETPNYLVGVTATDTEDGDLTSSIVVDTSNVNITLASTYVITYSVIDSQNSITFINRNIIVEDSSNGNNEIKGEPISTPEEFRDRINKNKSGIFTLACNLDFSNFDYSVVTFGIAEGNFSGKLYGNNHTITGLKENLFDNISSGYIENLNITGADLDPQVGGYIARPLGILSRRVINGSELKNISLIDSRVHSESEWGYGLLTAEFYDSSIDGLIISGSQIDSISGRIGMVCTLARDSSLTNFEISGRINSKEHTGMICGRGEGSLFVSNGNVSGILNVTTRNSIGTIMGGNKNYLHLENVEDNVIIIDSNNITPILDIGEDISIYTGETPNYMGGVTAIDQEEGDLTSSIIVDSSSVDITKAGVYPVTYTITDADLATVTDTKNVYVNTVIIDNNYDLLTSLTTSSLESGFYEPKLGKSLIGDSPLKVEIDNVDTIFEDGYGVAPNTTMTYDISNADYISVVGKFGVDKNLQANNDTSMKLYIKSDGETIYESPLVDFINPTVSFDLDVTDKSTLSFEIKDTGDGTLSDIGALINVKLNRTEPVVDGMTYSEAQAYIEENNLSIPDLNEIFLAIDFDPNRLIAYNNIRILNTQEESTNILEANKIAIDDKLNTMPLNAIKYKRGYRLAKYMTVENVNTFNRVALFYTDEVIEVRDVSYTELSNGKAIYSMDGVQTENDTKIIDIYSSEVQTLKTMLDTYTFDNVLESLGGRRIQKNKIRYSRDGVGIVEDRDLYMLDEQWNKLKGDTLDLALTIITFSPNSQDILDNKQNLDLLLFSITYLERWHRYQIGGFTGVDTLLYYPKLFNKDTALSSSYIMEKIKNESKTYLQTDRVGDFFNRRLAKSNYKYAYKDYINNLVFKLERREDYAQRFKDNFPGFIYEKDLSVPVEGATWRAYDKLSQWSANYIALAMAYEGNTLAFATTRHTIFISDLAIYENSSLEQTKSKIPKYFDMSISMYDTLFRVTEGEENRIGVLNPHFDTLSRQSGNGWVNPNDSTYTGIHQFFLSVGMVTNSGVGYAGVANGWTSNLGWSNMWSGYGHSVWSHETTHNQDGSLWLEGKGRRGKKEGGYLFGAEDYATGLYERETGKSWGMNLGEAVDPNNIIYTNYSPNRFTDKKEFQEYFKRANDLSMALNILEVEYLATRDASAQARAFDKYNYGSVNPNSDGNYNYKQEHYTDITEEEAGMMNIQSIDDIIENKLELFRSGRPINANKGGDSYNKTSLGIGYTYFPFSEHTNGRVSAEFFKRINFLLFGNYNYQDGYVKYASNQLRANSDIDVLKSITGDENVTAESFNKTLYHEVENRMNTEGMSVYTVDELRQMIALAYERDEANNTFNNIKNLRFKIWLDFKKATNEFQDDIFGETIPTRSLVTIDTAEEFRNITNNKSGFYIIGSDIDFSDFDYEPVTWGIVEGYFSGVILGNNHVISGLKETLIDNIKGGYVENLTISNAEIDANNKDYGVRPLGILSRRIENKSLLKNITLKNSKVYADNFWGFGGLAGFLYDSEIDGLTISNTLVSTNYKNGRLGLVSSESKNITINNFDLEGTVLGSNELGIISGRLISGYLNLKNGTINGTVGAKTNNDIGTLVGLNLSNGLTLENIEDNVVIDQQ